MILKNLTGADVQIADLGEFVIPASNQVDTNLLFKDYEVLGSLDLKAQITANNVVINDGVSDLSPTNSLQYITPTTGYGTSTLTAESSSYSYQQSVAYTNTVSGNLSSEISLYGLKSQPLSQFNSTTSSQLAGVISDETGTGKLTFATDPVFLGAPNFPTGAIAVTQTTSANNTSLATTAFVQNNVLVHTKALTANVSNSTATAAKLTTLDYPTGTGTFVFQYYILYQSSVTTTGVKFSVNHTGTVSSFVANMRYVDASATASTGAPSQTGNATTAQVMGSYSSRAKSATASMGPTLSVNTANADMLMIIEGHVVVTAAGNLELYHASENANATTVKAGTALVLTTIV